MTARRVLLVEDEPLLLMDLEDMVAEIGHTVVRAETTLAGAMRAVEAGGFDLVVMDLNLAGELATPVADALAARGLPFIIASGYENPQIAAAHARAPRLAKPYGQQALQAAVDRALSA